MGEDGGRSAHASRLAAADRVGDVVERRVGVRSNGIDGRQADDHDQRQHHGVFNGCWAVFRLNETLHLQSEILHLFLQKWSLAGSRIT